MKRFFIASILLAVLATSVSAQTVAFTNVSVIPMDRERVLANQTVLIKNGLIAEIGDAKKVKLPKEAIRVDGRSVISALPLRPLRLCGLFVLADEFTAEC